jgi:NAD(P)-dependent dehydrogenase (short-subunit alcohol dehydrogenase family)
MADLFREPVALVTGAASGIGAALARALAGRGARVWVTDRDAACAEATAAALPGARAAGLDVTDADAFAALAERVVAESGRIDLLFNNAGVGLAGAVRDLSLADWRRVIDVNVWGVIHGIHAVYPHLIRQGGGALVNVASGAALAPRPGMTAYAATKAAVVALSTSLRAEAALHGVQVNAICPGFIATNIMSSTTFRNVDGEGLMGRVPLKPITADDCARIALRGVEADRPIIPVSRMVSVDWGLFRLSPRLSTWVSGWRAKQFAAHRTEE